MALAKKYDGYFTYADYLNWPENERWEIIEGKAYPWNEVYHMSPAPSPIHQEISLHLVRQFANFLENKECKVYYAPFDVRFIQENQEEGEIDSVVQPDIAVICDKSKIDDKGCLGAPDLIVEILSPATAQKDMTIKFDLYEKNRVQEYWVVHPEEKYIEIFTSEEGQKESGKYGKAKRFFSGEKFFVPVFPEFEMDLSFLNSL